MAYIWLVKTVFRPSTAIHEIVSICKRRLVKREIIWEDLLTKSLFLDLDGAAGVETSSWTAFFIEYPQECSSSVSHTISQVNCVSDGCSAQFHSLAPTRSFNRRAGALVKSLAASDQQQHLHPFHLPGVITFSFPLIRCGIKQSAGLFASRSLHAGQILQTPFSQRTQTNTKT